MNISATINVFRLLSNPQLCVPHLTISSFDKIPIPFDFTTSENSIKPNIKAVVLDKDNCFAKDHDDKVWPEYQETFTKLRTQYPGASLLIVSNSAGTNDDLDHHQARTLEESTGVNVLRHSTKKPGCYNEIMNYFRANNICHKPEEVAVVGDRLFTDILMANMMGAWGVWISNGVVRSESLICRMERELNNRMVNAQNPYKPLIPGNFGK